VIPKDISRWISIAVGIFMQDGTTKIWSIELKRQEKPEATPGHRRNPYGKNKFIDKLEGVVDVDAIPSPQDEPVSATMVEEEEKSPVTVRMDIDPQSSAEEQNPYVSETPRKQPRVEVSHQTNGTDSERTKSEGPGS
jgi:hypothetical protein